MTGSESDILCFRLHKNESAEIRALAERLGLTTSALLRYFVVRGCKQELAMIVKELMYKDMIGYEKDMCSGRRMAIDI